MEQYAESLKAGSESAWPMAKLPKQVSAAVEQTMKGQPREEISKGVYQAVRDVLFLFHLHQQVNGKLMEKQEAFLFWLRWLRAELGRLRYHKMGRKASASGIGEGIPRHQGLSQW
jgi:hypothetical protein